MQLTRLNPYSLNNQHRTSQPADFFSISAQQQQTPATPNTLNTLPPDTCELNRFGEGLGPRGTVTAIIVGLLLANGIQQLNNRPTHLGGFGPAPESPANTQPMTPLPQVESGIGLPLLPSDFCQNSDNPLVDPLMVAAGNFAAREVLESFKSGDNNPHVDPPSKPTISPETVVQALTVLRESDQIALACGIPVEGGPDALAVDKDGQVVFRGEPVKSNLTVRGNTLTIEAENQALTATLPEGQFDGVTVLKGAQNTLLIQIELPNGPDKHILVETNRHSPDRKRTRTFWEKPADAATGDPQSFESHENVFRLPTGRIVNTGGTSHQNKPEEGGLQRQISPDTPTSST
ncbi:MAG: hypothetical protein SFZ03_03935 [Candidatus Melainabacteria bacterium]|nr:hypothetical protein [Candidatus Melainabacteria bacterium]